MERKKYPLIVLFCFMLVLSFGQSNNTIYQAYIIGNMARWKNAMDSIESVPDKTNKNKLDLINYQYGYIAWCIDKDKISEAEKYMKKSEELIKQLVQKEYNLSMLFAYKAAFIGFKIGISPYKAPFIGSESLNFAKQSVITDSTNALGFVQLGNIAFYTPKMFGGSKEEAMQHYLKALKLMDKQNNRTNNWNYLNLLATIINAYMELEQYEKAKYYCVKTLSVEPNFDWVKNKLYPQVLKQ
jgi:tetratricopeptide (TPR) repeat protein